MLSPSLSHSLSLSFHSFAHTRSRSRSDVHLLAHSLSLKHVNTLSVSLLQSLVAFWLCCETSVAMRVSRLEDGCLTLFVGEGGNTATVMLVWLRSMAALRRSLLCRFVVLPVARPGVPSCGCVLVLFVCCFFVWGLRLSASVCLSVSVFVGRLFVCDLLSLFCAKARHCVKGRGCPVCVCVIFSPRLFEEAQRGRE